MLQSDDVKDEDLPANTLELFSELDQVLAMIDAMKPIQDRSFEREFEQYTEVLSRYQEQPHLLDPHLELLLSRLLGKIRQSESPAGERDAAFKYLYIISKVRTYKVLVKFMPHELSDLEFVLQLLSQQDPKEFANWETRYVLLLWMSILVLNPFHMSRLDAYATTPVNNCVVNHVNVPQASSKMERIFELCKLYASTNDTCSSMAAYLSAKYFVRADIKDLYLERFLDWVIEQHQADTLQVKFGQLAAVAAILKHGKREDLLPYADKLLQWIVACQYKDVNDFLKYKYYVKIVQRLGLVHLKPRIASWRYKRAGTRSLATNLGQQSGATGNAAAVSGADDEAAGDGDEIVVPDAIEEVIEELLQALRSGGNDVRWSAAKGLGRVTNRLPKELADEVIGSVIDILNPLEPHEAWHGGCLALAELAKRGLLLPYRLRELVPLLMQALFYDEMKGYMSVGQHIRDAACYMCWAFARAYNPDDLKPFVQQISSGLLIVAVFDREINCRRAASAAFQESVGRLGNFPYGIEISTTTDFYSVGIRQSSYLNISDFIAQYEEYRQPLIDHLVQRKVGHWDSAIRELTAKALHKLTNRSPLYMAAVVMPQLLAKTDTIDVNARHGCVLAMGEITLALRQLELTSAAEGTVYLSNQRIAELNELIHTFLERCCYRGMSGELMKQCTANFIRNCSLAKLPVTEQCLGSWQTVIDMCLVSKTTQIREYAVDALAELCTAYYCESSRHTENELVINAYLKGAHNDLEEHIRMGYLAALGVLPAFMLRPHLSAVLDNLVKHSLPPQVAHEEHENVQTYRWSEARKESVHALRKLVQTVGYETSTGDSFGNRQHFNKVIECLLQGLDEYTLDNRGDIGAWVREAAMTALYEIITQCPKELLLPQHVHQTMVGFMQQAVEKIDRTRGLAGRLCCRLIHVQPAIPYVRDHERLLEIFPSDESSVLWLFADHTFPLFCELLALPAYSKRVLLGLSASIGQLTESLIKYASTALFQFMRSHVEMVPRLCAEIVQNFEAHLLNERVTYPMLSFLERIIASSTIDGVLHDESNPFAEDIYRLLNLEVKGYKKLYKTASSISAFCQLVQVPRLSKRVLSKMSVFLGLQHVHVRKTAATKLYEALALHGDVTEIPEDNMDEILALLSETDWTLPLVEVRPLRNELCNLMGIKPPVSGASAATVAKTSTVPDK
ncbi:hypothetical protein KR215_009267 [Drosophila sulfurigaster]|nr:hypothetical protein KR215_009267 [Drosophila sulfurigaster]